MRRMVRVVRSFCWGQCQAGWYRRSGLISTFGRVCGITRDGVVILKLSLFFVSMLGTACPTPPESAPPRS